MYKVKDDFFLMVNYLVSTRLNFGLWNLIYIFKYPQQISARTQMYHCFSIQFPSYYSLILNLQVAHEKNIESCIYSRYML